MLQVIPVKKLWVWETLNLFFYQWTKHQFFSPWINACWQKWRNIVIPNSFLHIFSLVKGMEFNAKKCWVKIWPAVRMILKAM